MVSQGGNQGGSGSNSGAAGGAGPRRTGAGPGKAGRPERKSPLGGKGGAGFGGKSFGKAQGERSGFGQRAGGAGKGAGGAGKSGTFFRKDAEAHPERRSGIKAEKLPPGARIRALWLLNAVLIEGRTLAAALPEATAGLEPSEAARAGRLATDTLRHMGRADRMLSPYLRLKPTEPVMNLLRLATIELARGGAAHGVVHAAVTLARQLPDTAAAAGLANAVLRRVSEKLVPLETLPVPTLPKSLRKQLVAAWGKEAVAAMEQVFTQSPPVDLTSKDGGSLAETLGGTALPTGSTRLTEARQISALPGFETGVFWVQDAAAALPALVLAPKPGEKVLDLCAAPGGKTLQLAAAGATVTALDLSAERMARVAENLQRTGLSAELVVADALSWPKAAPKAKAAPGAALAGAWDGSAPVASTDFPEDQQFDAILLDAPCSATGTIRRHPDLPHLRAEAELAPLLVLQAKLIDRAFALLRPGGRLVFCTCSLLPEEGELQAKAALARLPGLSRDAKATQNLAGTEAFACAPGEIRTRPDHWAEMGGIDGFYIAAFRKASPGAPAEAEVTEPAQVAAPIQDTAPAKELAEAEFAALSPEGNSKA